MSNTLNALTKKYAVLMDAAYRKNIAWDQGFDIEEDLDAFGFSNFNEILTGNDSIAVKYRDGSPEGRILINEGHYYNPATGFSAFIVNDNTKILVVLRGTDSASSSVTGTIADSIPLIANPERTDAGDGNSNLFLGFGTAGVTQWDDVRALIHAVATSRNLDLTDEEDKQQIAVVGQSLGGGLAGLASAYFGLEGHVYAPAPFALQLDTEADLLAVEQLIKLHEADNSGIKFSSEFLAKSDALQRNDLKTNLPIALSESLTQN